MKQLVVQEVLALFSGVKKVAICGHVNPDGDALGSALALAALLRAQGCEATCLLAQDRPAPLLYTFLEDYNFVPACNYTDSPELFITVDLPVASRLGDALPHFERAPKTLCIDHHPDYSDYCDAYFGDTQASATGALIWELVKASGMPITAAVASYCYVAVMTDTGRFSFQNTNEHAFSIAAEMVHYGVRPTEISQNVYENKSMAMLKLEARLIERMRFAFDNAFVYSWITEDDFNELGVSRDDTESLPTTLRSIQGVEVAVLLRSEGSAVRANFRSRGCCNVGELARSFGGGGHSAASGATLECTLDEAAAMLIKALSEHECFGGTGTASAGSGASGAGSSDAKCYDC
jgi:phosphoesterase RecJ-like protein